MSITVVCEDPGMDVETLMSFVGEGAVSLEVLSGRTGEIEKRA